MYTYMLPDQANNSIVKNTNNNALIIIGANGSGKSKLGAWIEQQNPGNTHRIGAQRSLIFGDYIQQKSYEQSTNLLLYGKEKVTSVGEGHDQRWQWDGSKYNYTSSMLNDYEHVLSAILALRAKQQDEYIKECKKLEQEEKQHNNVPEMVDDTLLRIWKSIFPHREIDISDGKVMVNFEPVNGQKKNYKGRDMSDGERVALYLIAQALCIPKNKTIIIDEPEIHLHRSIMNRLWTALEKERTDCLFIYITHDTQFAANHRQAKKIWVKSFDGQKWDWEEVQDTELPEQLLLNILGNRKPVLFVEGEADSYDTKLYTEVFKQYYVVPCGGCSSVIAWTKAMNKTSQLHEVKCYGLIDRDYRSDYEIEKYKEDNIYTLGVAEVENLFLVPEVLEAVNEIMAFPDDSKIVQVKKYIMVDRFKNQINRQICESVVAELKYMLASAEISKKDETEAKEALDALFISISYENKKQQHTEKFQAVLDSDDYKQVLAVFNCKALSTSIGHFFGMKDNEYCDFVLRQLLSKNADKIIDALSGYIPSEIPRDSEEE